MGWNPFASSDPRGDSIRSGTAVPSRSERLQCWTSRDAYFACLDANSITDANANPGATQRACPVQTADFERDCAAEWVRYFKKWRVAELQKRARLEELKRQGAQEMTVTASFAPEGGVGEKGKGRGDIQDMLDRKRG